ncbi:MAG: 50S ribosomal protein L22 [Planctomycetota bacterium]|jgi:large subunit ribosomal protein L22
MSYHAIHRHARIAPRKARLIANLIRGKRIDEALTALEFSKKRAAWYFKSVLKSAIANAEEGEADVHNLFVSASRVDQGPAAKRWRPKDRGRAHPFKKYTSHLHVTVDVRS